MCKDPPRGSSQQSLQTQIVRGHHAVNHWERLCHWLEHGALMGQKSMDPALWSSHAAACSGGPLALASTGAAANATSIGRA